ncbi:hypothetical protein E3N88_42592 [Mikania micrantha]|uniref:Uncharacterized protein n=1 Tax=Mikania micrantha TaxID=192012 RepID=A0A5N6LHA2_9ASTR|nr:hypothetical protein E3N88_42592 [Mikania micrantha]
MIASMERDQRKRRRAADGGGGELPKKERETKGKDPVVVPPPTEDEVDEFFAILRRMREAVKCLKKDKDVVGKLSDPSREAVDGEVRVKKRTGVSTLDLNTVPDDRE